VARLDLYSFHGQMLMCHFISPLLAVYGILGPLGDSPECCNLPFAQRSCSLTM